MVLGVTLARTRDRRLAARLVLVLSFCLVLIYYLWSHNKSPLLCTLYPDPGNIAIAVKTGATEPREKLWPILQTCLQCVKDVMILSDMEDTQGPYQFHDVLAHFTQAQMADNPDFALYNQLRSLKAAGQNEELERLRNTPVSESDSRRLGVPSGKGAGWVLDKYKFLHMVDAAWSLQPGKQWYVFLETDTYISWAGLLRWLALYDPEKAWFLGNEIQKDPKAGASSFAQGGSGVVLSGVVVQELAERKLTRTWDDRAHRWNAGDFLFADFLHHEMSLAVTNAWPAFNEHNSSNADYWTSAWCEPVVTLHRFGESSAFERLHERERSLGFQRLSRFDVYTSVFPEDFEWPSTRSDWDNHSEAREHRIRLPADIGFDANANAENCRLACESTAACFQYMFRNTTVVAESRGMHECALSNAFRLGIPKAPQQPGNVHEPGVARSWTSGWRSEKIRRSIEEPKQCEGITDDPVR